VYKAIIFDFYGIFVPDQSLLWFQSNVPHYQTLLPAFEEICSKSNVGELTQDQFAQAIGSLTNIELETVKTGIATRDQINGELLNYVRHLKDSYKIGLLTNATREEILSITNKHHISTLFDEIVTSAEIGLEKPDPKIFDYILTKMNIHASEVIFIDDRERNTNAARSLGINSITFINNEQLFDELVSQNILQGA
jgi:putative hydrolase of the HAD superfamily